MGLDFSTESDYFGCSWAHRHNIKLEKLCEKYPNFYLTTKIFDARIFSKSQIHEKDISDH